MNIERQEQSKQITRLEGARLLKFTNTIIIELFLRVKNKVNKVITNISLGSLELNTIIITNPYSKIKYNMIFHDTFSYSNDIWYELSDTSR